MRSTIASRTSGGRLKKSEVNPRRVDLRTFCWKSGRRPCAEHNEIVWSDGCSRAVMSASPARSMKCYRCSATSCTALVRPHTNLCSWVRAIVETFLLGGMQGEVAHPDRRVGSAGLQKVCSLVHRLAFLRLRPQRLLCARGLIRVRCAYALPCGSSKSGT
jgi:hypothetical protein